MLARFIDQSLANLTTTFVTTSVIVATAAPTGVSETMTAPVVGPPLPAPPVADPGGLWAVTGWPHRTVAGAASAGALIPTVSSTRAGPSLIGLAPPHVRSPPAARVGPHQRAPPCGAAAVCARPCRRSRETPGPRRPT